jgi:hypothetical protein
VGRTRAVRRGQENRAVRLLCGFSGLLAGGLVALAVALVVVEVVARQRAMPGPGTLTIAGHVAAAVAAVLIQRRADHAGGVVAAGAALAVVALSVVVLAVQWLV